MSDNKIDLEYFERGLGLILGQLEYLIELTGKIDYKYVEPLNFKSQAFEVVEDDEEFQKLAAAFSDIRQDIIDDPLFKDDREVFLLLTEIDRLNNQLLILLNEDNGSHSLVDVQKYLVEKFQKEIREILALEEKITVLDPQAIEILKILANEKKFADIEEGINLVVSLTELNEKTKPIYESLSEAHILAIYHDLLKQKLED